MRHSIYCLATDLLDEGAGQVLDNVQGRGGVNGVTVAVRYHAAADLYPHNPRRKAATVPPGSYYRAAATAGSPLAPGLSPLAAERDVLAETCDAAAARGLEVAAWAVLLHADQAGPDHPGVQLNCWGDPLAGALCPASPEVRDHVRAVVTELSAYPVTTVRAESLHYHGFRHGHHHERLLDGYGPLTLWLLGICFCAHCLAAARERGVDGHRVAQRVRGWVAGSLEAYRPEPELSPAAAAQAGGDELLAYLHAQAEVVTSLVAAASEAASGNGTALSFIDPSVSSVSYQDGTMSGPAGAERGWQAGIDARSIARAGAVVEVCAYLSDLDRFGQELAAYRAAVPAPGSLSVVVRPGRPDATSPAEMAAKARAVAAAGCPELNFYGYGLYRLGALDLVRGAVEASVPPAGAHGPQPARED